MYPLIYINNNYIIYIYITHSLSNYYIILFEISPIRVTYSSKLDIYIYIL